MTDPPRSIRPRNGWPSPVAVLKGVGTFLAPIALSVIAWLAMDWVENRVVLANTVQKVETVEADMKVLRDETKAGMESQRAIQAQLFENSHRTDLAIQRLTDLIANHDEDIGENERDIRELRRQNTRRRRTNGG